MMPTSPKEPTTQKQVTTSPELVSLTPASLSLYDNKPF